MKQRRLFSVMTIAVMAWFGSMTANAQEVYAVLSEDGETVTFYYDGLRDEREEELEGTGTVTEIDNYRKSGVVTAVFDASFVNYLPASMERWFEGSSRLTTIRGLGNLNMSNVTSMRGMFEDCSSLVSIDLSSLNTSSVTDMTGMFRRCASLKSINWGSFNTSKVTSMGEMFVDCISLTSLNLSQFNTSNVTEMYRMFSGCSSLTSLDLSQFDTGNVVNMGGIFNGCSSLTNLNLSNFNTSNVTEMYNMFSGCSSLTSLDLSQFDTRNVVNMASMFSGCSSLTSLDLSRFDTSNVTEMYGMFSSCAALTDVDLSSFNTSKVGDMRYMFEGCSSLTSLDLSSFNTENMYLMGGMFKDCSSLKTIYADEKIWNAEIVTYGPRMFTNCTSIVGGNGTTYNEYYTNQDYARIDKPGQRGYLTQKSSSGIQMPTSISTRQNGTAWYTLDGMRLKDEPVEKGVYVSGGRKVVMK